MLSAGLPNDVPPGLLEELTMEKEVRGKPTPNIVLLRLLTDTD